MEKSKTFYNDLEQQVINKIQDIGKERDRKEKDRERLEKELSELDTNENIILRDQFYEKSAAIWWVEMKLKHDNPFSKAECIVKDDHGKVTININKPEENIYEATYKGGFGKSAKVNFKVYLGKKYKYENSLRINQIKQELTKIKEALEYLEKDEITANNFSSQYSQSTQTVKVEYDSNLQKEENLKQATMTLVKDIAHIEGQIESRNNAILDYGVQRKQDIQKVITGRGNTILLIEGVIKKSEDDFKSLEQYYNKLNLSMQKINEEKQSLIKTNEEICQKVQEKDKKLSILEEEIKKNKEIFLTMNEIVSILPDFSESNLKEAFKKVVKDMFN